MGWWKDFDPGEVVDEFDVVAGLGLRLVRIFLLWEDFQPTPTTVSATALADLETVCDLAAERALGLDVTFFTGHMSGPNWAPPWLLGGDEPVPAGRQVVSGANEDAGSYRNPFVDHEALRAAELQLRTVVTRLHDHPGIFAWNLGNEPDLFARPPDDVGRPGLGAAAVRGHPRGGRPPSPHSRSARPLAEHAQRPARRPPVRRGRRVRHARLPDLRQLRRRGPGPGCRALRPR